MGLLNRVGVQASYYGHAAPGLLHVRPKLNLHTAEDIAKYRTICDEVSALCIQFKGSLAGEHGVGITRTEYLPEHLGPELMAATRELKRLFDPKGTLQSGQDRLRWPVSAGDESPLRRGAQDRPAVHAGHRVRRA